MNNDENIVKNQNNSLILHQSCNSQKHKLDNDNMKTLFYNMANSNLNIKFFYPNLTTFGSIMNYFIHNQLTIFTPKIIEVMVKPITKVLSSFSKMQQEYLDNITQVITNVSNNYFQPLLDVIRKLDKDPNNIFNG